MLPPCAVLLPICAAGLPPINTVILPINTVSGGPTHMHISPTQAAGIPPIITVGQPGDNIGPPTCGMGGKPGVTIGHTCMLVSVAAGGIVAFIFFHLSIGISLS